MKITEIVAAEQLVLNPFPLSKIQNTLYHGTSAKFQQFDRSLHGIYVTTSRSWAKTHYGENVIPLYANITKIKKLDYDIPEEDTIIELFYDRDYSAVATVLDQLASKGYDACWFGGESDSIVLFNNIQIINASSGEPM